VPRARRHVLAHRGAHRVRERRALRGPADDRGRGGSGRPRHRDVRHRSHRELDRRQRHRDARRDPRERHHDPRRARDPRRALPAREDHRFFGDSPRVLAPAAARSVPRVARAPPPARRALGHLVYGHGSEGSRERRDRGRDRQPRLGRALRSVAAPRRHSGSTRERDALLRARQAGRAARREQQDEPRLLDAARAGRPAPRARGLRRRRPEPHAHRVAARSRTALGVRVRDGARGPSPRYPRATCPRSPALHLLDGPGARELPAQRVTAGMKPKLRRIPRYFLRGALVTAPLALTFYIVYWLLALFDQLLPVGIPGLGIVATLALITFVGFLTSNVVGRSVLETTEGILKRVPLVKLVYTSIKDLVGAFVGDRRSFDRP